MVPDTKSITVCNLQAALEAPPPKPRKARFNFALSGQWVLSAIRIRLQRAVADTAVREEIRENRAARQAFRKEVAACEKRLSTACLVTEAEKEAQKVSKEGDLERVTPEIRPTKKPKPEIFLRRLMNPVCRASCSIVFF